MDRRSISLTLLESVMANPQQIVIEKENLKAYQSVVSIEEKDPFLLRIIVNDAVEPAMVVTAYKTSKISKYWRTI